MTPLQVGVLVGRDASAAYALPTKPMAAKETPARRTLFIFLPQVVRFGRLQALFAIPFAFGSIFRWRNKENRYGLLHRFIKIKYLNLRFWPPLLADLSVASGDADKIGKICRIPRRIRDFQKWFLIVFNEVWLFRHILRALNQNSICFLYVGQPISISKKYVAPRYAASH